MKTFENIEINGTNCDLYLSEESYEHELGKNFRRSGQRINEIYKSNPEIFYKIYGSVERGIEDFKKQDLKRVANNLMIELLDWSSGVSFETLEKVLEERKSNRIAILNAHGGTIREEWCYSDNKKYRTINSWIIGQTNKRYGSLLLVCCNKNNNIPEVIDTPLFFAKGRIGFLSKYEAVLMNTK
ncbi:hypothetical protein COS83_00195 [archaeon CG07_land_8_20_14_0_80_38_8]|nr:MAG: hypothetical protein COS83_00195 [archaeon CG07_land_8_20_14_0_80_38_8]PIU88345.1 MAG: hypothetical protein COS64_04200 [archaeon CG06_land_8_20_14_3_00_37_11]